MPVFVRILAVLGVTLALAPGVSGASGADVYRTLEGVRDTAMLPRAGFSDLGDSDVAAAVDYMLRTLKLSIPETGKETVTTESARPTLAKVDDATLIASVTEALHMRVLPRAQVEGARVGGITVEARDGHVALRGMVVIAADLFEHD